MHSCEAGIIEPYQGCANGGLDVMITGTCFEPGFKVYFGEKQSPSIQVIDNNTIIAKTSPGTENSIVDVRVISPEGVESILPSAFHYGLLVKVNSIYPYSTRLEGGREITIFGENFTYQSIVILRSQLKDGSKWEEIIEPSQAPTNSEIKFITPAAPEILIADVCVKNVDCGEVCLNEALGYYDGITNELPFTPWIGITAGYTPVVFFGHDLYISKICDVKFDGISAKRIYKQDGKLIA